MFETVIKLKPDWRAGMTTDKLIAELDQALQFPGVANAWTMPIKARIDVVSTGIRTPIGIKVFGKDLDEMEKLAREIEAVEPKVSLPRPPHHPPCGSAVGGSTSWHAR